MIEVHVFGNNGRISRLIQHEAQRDCNFVVTQGIPDVYIEFTHESKIEEHLEKALEFKKSIVLGTTGLSEKQFMSIEKASLEIKVFYAPNMSFGIEVLRRAMVLAAKMLEHDHDIEIHELHHKLKKDAPSGTALSLAKTIQGLNLKWNKIKNYQETPLRKENDIGISVGRGGEGYNAHTVSFIDQDGMLELKYHNWNPSVYARGALECAKFLMNIKEDKGLYSMKDLSV